MTLPLMAQLAASQLVTAAVGTAEWRDPAPLANASVEAVKPYKDWLPQVQACSGESNHSSEAFLAQYYLYAMQQKVP
jgi:hypothetical protein